MNKLKLLAVLIAPLIPALGTPTASATDDPIIIIGEPIPDACEEAWGPGYGEVIDAVGNLIGCECTTAFWCGGDELAPGDGGGGGGGRGGDDEDECAADDAQCTCEAEEKDPAVCEVSCAECSQELGDCLDQVAEDREECETNNADKATFLCEGKQGNYATVADCVDASLNGFPGIGNSTTTGSNSGWSVSVKGVLGKLGNSVGLDVGYNSSTSRSQKNRVYYPPIPVNRNIYPDCTEIAGDDYDSCNHGELQCNESVADQFGEICEEK